MFYLNQKQKIYVALKLLNSEFLKNMVAPPFETNVTVRNTFTWDVPGIEENCHFWKNIS